MSLRIGVVERIEREMAFVRRATDGKLEAVALVRLRGKGKQSQISEFVEAVVESANLEISES